MSVKRYLSSERATEIKEQLLNFTKQEVVNFLEENPEKVFYAFAYDCNAAYAEVGLSFNTEEAFEESLDEYQAKFSDFTDEYAAMPKTPDFRFFCADHDEDFEAAIARQNKVLGS